MISIPLIGVAAGLVACALAVKMFAGEAKKAAKAQKGDILKQLLALSEQENRAAGTASSVRLRAPLVTQSTRSSNSPPTRTQPSLPPSRSKA